MEYVKEKNKILAYDNKKIVGSIFYNKNHCEIIDLFVNYNYKNKKIGTTLLAKAEEELKKNGCKKSYLVSGRLNMNEPRPDNFYLNNNYKWQNPILRYFLVNPFHMEKEL